MLVRRFLPKFLAFFAIIFFCQNAVAAIKAKQWQVIGNESKITFTALQNTSKIEGSFEKFSSEIFFDQANLANSSAKVQIDLDSIKMSFADAVPTAKNKDWFDVKSFPQAIFTTKKFSKIADKKFHVDGTLKIKGHEVAVGFDFILKDSGTNKTTMEAEFPLLRSVFDVGAKDKKAANGVKDEIKVKIVLVATTK